MNADTGVCWASSGVGCLNPEGGRNRVTESKDLWRGEDCVRCSCDQSVLNLSVDGHCLELRNKFEQVFLMELEQDACCVCLVTVGPPRIKCLPCGHCIHKSCAVRWLARSRTCPLCREPVPERPSQILKRVLGEGPVMNLPGVVKSNLANHPEVGRAVSLAFLTMDPDRYLSALRGLQL